MRARPPGATRYLCMIPVLSRNSSSCHDISRQNHEKRSIAERLSGEHPVGPPCFSPGVRGRSSVVADSGLAALFGSAEHIAVDRGLSEFRSGRPVLISGTG